MKLTALLQYVRATVLRLIVVNFVLYSFSLTIMEYVSLKITLVLLFTLVSNLLSNIFPKLRELTENNED